jgi:5-methylcytosine-specific restriction endonuclease McrA
MKSAVCSKCGITKSVSEFYRRSDTKKYRRECKQCFGETIKQNNEIRHRNDPNYWSKRYKAERDRNPERYNERQRLSARRRRAENSEPFLMAERRYRAKHPERVREAHKRWRLRNLAWYRNKEARRKSQKAGLLATLTVDEWEEILDEYSHLCAYCGVQGEMTQDHVIPLSRGGDYTKDNIVPACKSCNSSKRDRTPNEWDGQLCVV